MGAPKEFYDQAGRSMSTGEMVKELWSHRQRVAEEKKELDYSFITRQFLRDLKTSLQFDPARRQWTISYERMLLCAASNREYDELRGWFFEKEAAIGGK
jgi:hypothetical protein